MRVNRSQLVRGAAEYVRGEILPKMGDDKALQIILTVTVNAAFANGKTIDAVLNNGVFKALLEDDGSGTYELDGITDALRSAIELYGSFPVRIPAIPLISPHEITLKLGAADVDALKRSIENAAG